MASYDPTLLNIDPYYDDYDEDKKFLRVLFRPGYAVQARELTQLQSILQNQVSRMGDHIFEDGAKIIGGDQSVQNCSYIRVVKGASLDQIGGYDISQIKTDGSTTENVSARVVHYERTPTSTVDNYDLLYVNFLQGNTFQPGGTFGSTFVGGTGAGEIAPVSSDSTDATVVNGVQGRCKVITTSPGIFYTDGFFVKTDKQSTSIYGFTGDGTREFVAPSGSVGFSIRRSVATEGNDATLRDPASGSYNYNAPGADRYKIDLNLGFVTDISTTKNFIELVRFDIGKVIFKTLYTDYAELEKTLARRTYDESGSYTVKPFEIDLREHLNNGSNRGVYSSDRGGDSSKLVSVLQPGKAYLYGYEYETQSPQFLDVNKSRSTSTSSLTKLPGAKLGNYFVGVEVDINGAGPTPVGSGTEWQGNRSFFSTLLVEGDNIIKSSSPVQLWDDAFQLIGTARVHAFKREDDALNLSGMDAEDVWPRPHDGNGILDTKYVYRMYVESFIPGGSSQATLSTATYMTPGLFREPANILNNDFPTLKLIRNISATDTDQTLRDIKNSGLVFEVPQGKTVKSIDQLRYVYSRSQIITTDTNNVATWSLSITTDPDGVHQFFNESGDEIITNNDDYILMARPGDGLPYEIVDYYYQDVSSRPVYTRSSDGKTLTISIPTDGNEENEYLLIAPIVAQDKGAADANITSPTIRSKTFTNNFQEFISTDCRNEGTALDPIWYVEMNKFDVNKVTHMSGGEPSDFLFDDGQRETRYINGKLYIKPEKFSTYVTPDETNPFNGVLNAPIGVTYDYFQHSGAVGPFTVESYAGITYGDIPLFASNSLGKTTSLASCIDFRHSGPVSNELGTHVIPEDNLVSIEESHTFYQARIDKLVARQTFGDDINFDIIEGVPDLSPVAPADRPDSMTLYTIALPPYTHNASDVAVKYIENNRYTMADIGKVEKRVDDLEIYTKLSLIENEIEAMDIEKSTEPGVIGEKVGIVVDTFAGHGLGDVADNKYACSIDYENSTLRPGFAETNHALDTATLVIGDNLQQSSDGLIHSKITDTQSIVSQPLSNGFISVNQFDLINWIGRLEIDPPSDQWFSTTVRPVVKINDIGSNDNWKVNNFNDSRGFGTQWNEWSSIWSGIENIDDKLQNVVGERFLEQARRVNSDIFIASRIEKNVSSVSNIAKTIDQRKSRLNIRLGSVPDTLKKRVNDKIIDVSVVPFIRSSTLTIKAENLKPNSILVPFFDGDDVSQFCTPDGGSLGNTIQTDSFGKITNLKFAIPPKKYLTGEKVFRLTDSSTNTAADAETSAEGVFYAQGVQNTTDTTFSATRPIVLRRQTVTSEKIVRDVYTREDSLNLSLETQWIDPLSQIFTVSPNLYSNGVFLNDINLYFSSKSETLPVTIQIRPTVSGYPSASSIIPFSEVTLYPSEVIIGNDAPSATNFKFTSPVYLQPGNYSLSIVSNTDDYKVYTGNIGLEDSLTGNIITKHPNMGSLFLPQNTNVAEENTSTSIMCEINRCVFTTAPGTLQVDLSEPGVTTNVNLTKIISNELILPSTSVVHKLTFGTSSTTFQVPQNQNYSFSSSQLIPATGGSPEQQTTHTIEFSNPSSSTITPVVDTKNLTLITVENIINNASGGGSYTQENYTDSAVARYLTRSIKLQENGDDVRVMLDLNRPIGTSVEVYCRTLSPTTYKEIAEEPFYQLEQVNEVTETDNPFEFAETSFKLLKSVDSFSTLQVKILMFSGDTSVVPQVKDLRVVALA